MDGAEPDRTLEYLRADQVVDRAESWTVVLGLFLVLYSGLYREAAVAVSGLEWPVVLEGVGFVLVAMAALLATKLPFGFVRQFVVQERFGFNEASVGQFLKIQTTGMAFSLLIQGVLVPACSRPSRRFRVCGGSPASVSSAPSSSGRACSRPGSSFPSCTTPRR